MSERVKKSNRRVKPQVGFLRPTIASQRRCIGHSNYSLPSPKLKKKGSPKKCLQTSLRSNLSSSFGEQSDYNGDLQSAVQVYASKPKHKKEKLDNGKEDVVSLRATGKSSDDLAEAKKMCEELKEQINELRLHQESYELRMKSFNSTIPQQHRQHEHRDVFEHVSTQDENKQQITFDKLPSHPHTDSIIRVNVDKSHKPFKDASNLPEQLSYNQSFCIAETPESVIKKLHSERDKYKRKVLKLQTELKIVKSNKTTFLKTPEICLQDLIFFNADFVGEGRLAVVYEGTLCGKPVAVKKLMRSGVMTASDRSYLAAEAGLLLPLDHQNIVKVMGVCSTPMEPLIITDFVNGKSVSQLLNKSGGGLDAATFFSVARDTSIGMAYLHSQKPPVLHLNLRPSNVLIDAFLRAKITDFGFSKIRIDAGVSNCSNLAYLAPELVKFPAQITVKTDVFAFAVLMWHMTTGRDPMAGRTTSQILEMMDKNQRLHIHSDLPPSIQKLISSCWDTLSVQRPSFKEIILDFETMNLPDDWTSKLKEIGILRTDMTDMASTIHDTNSVSSSVTSASHHQAIHTSTPACIQESGGYLKTSHHNNTSPYMLPDNHWPPSSSLYRSQSKTKWNFTDSSVLYKASNPNEDLSWRNKSKFAHPPAPLGEVRYIPGGVRNVSEILATDKRMPESHFVEDRLKSRVRSEDQLSSASSSSDKAVLHPPKKAWQAEAADQQTNHCNGETGSRFDNKFRDFVSGACQAESSSKVNAASCIRWPHVRSDASRQKNKSLVSSDNIRVRSASMQSCSTSASASKNSSMDTAVYIPQNDNNPHAQMAPEFSSTLNDADIRVSSVEPEPEKTLNRPVDVELRSDLLKGKAILSNAKRLLSTSPLRNGFNNPSYKLSSYQTGSYLPASFHEVRPLPEYKPSRALPDHRHSRSDPVHVRSESSSQDGSHESFLPLPPRLQTAHYAFPLPTLSKSPSPEHGKSKTKAKLLDVDATERDVDANDSKASDVSGPPSGRDDKPSRHGDRVAQILNRTAGELGMASDLLYTTSEKIKFKNAAARKSCGSV